MRIFTVGHGARPIDELLEVLAGAGVRTLVDVRRFPGSRRHPQFDQGALAASLEGAGIAAAGLCVAVGLVLADLVRGRDVPGLVWLLLPGVRPSRAASSGALPSCWRDDAATRSSAHAAFLGGTGRRIHAASSSRVSRFGRRTDSLPSSASRG